jgi:dihydrodipicolinate synthase/N-acetylneuraminate lyase
VRIAPAVVAALAGHRQIVGIKDSRRDLEYTQAVLYASAGADFAVLTGSDTLLLATITLGGAGAVVGSANLVADPGTAVYDAALMGDLVTARPLQQRLFEVVSAVRAAGFPTGWKAALELAGICLRFRPRRPRRSPGTRWPSFAIASWNSRCSERHGRCRFRQHDAPLAGEASETSVFSGVPR